MSTSSIIKNATAIVYKLIEKHKYESFIGLAFAVVCSVMLSKRKTHRKNDLTKKKLLAEDSENNICEVLFFSDKNSVCIDHIHSELVCTENCGIEKLNKLVAYLESATDSLDICVYTITSFKLGEVVLRKFREGVKVRVITDESMSYGDGSQIPLFRKNSVPVRVRVSQYLMHHKFAIIDKRILVNGSFNWTQQATFGNWENVIITSTPKKLVAQYCSHFEELWNLLNLD